MSKARCVSSGGETPPELAAETAALPDSSEARLPPKATPAGCDQFQSARIFWALTTCSFEPVKPNCNFPDLRVTWTSMVSRPSRFMRAWSCFCASWGPCFWRLLLMVEDQCGTGG
jgi:hypothetical protein